MGRVYEQIPHPKIAYAYLAIEAGTWNEFETLRSEALKRHPLYKTSAFEKSAPVSAPSVATEAEAGVEVAAEAKAADKAADKAVPSEQASTPAPTSEGLSPRDKAKAALAAKKGA
jgi:hypothetical protein